MIRARATAGLIVGSAWLALACTGPAGAAVWRVRSTPNPKGATRSQLVGISCPSRRFCFAVGYSSVRAGAYTPLAERWNGGRWSLQRVPRPAGSGVSVLSSISCAAPRDCTAVGYLTNRAGAPGPLAERWNGSRWSGQRPPRPGAATNLLAVSCPSRSACTAVGSYQDSSGTQRALAEGWDGRRWSIEPTPPPADAKASQLTGVSCTSPAACTAVGTFLELNGNLLTLVERWTGSAWSIQPSPDPGLSDSELTGVSCASPVSCQAVGFFAPAAPGLRALAEHWDGTSWAIQPIPNRPGRTNELFGVACAAPTACAAVGDFANRRGAFTTLVEQGGRIRWVIQPTSRPAGSSNSGLDSVSCPARGSCTAVGYVIERSGQVATLAERLG
jgi:hypothetical protein